MGAAGLREEVAPAGARDRPGRGLVAGSRGSSVARADARTDGDAAAPHGDSPPTVAPLGTALVSSNVYAQVAIDGRAQGGVLAARPIRLAAGRHVASFESGGFGPIRVPFEVKPGESVAVRADFPPLGQLWIHVNPDAVGAELFIDGERVGRAGNAPLKKTVAAGERRVEARLPGFEPAEATVSVFEQEKEDVRLELRRK